MNLASQPRPASICSPWRGSIHGCVLVINQHVPCISVTKVSLPVKMQFHLWNSTIVPPVRSFPSSQCALHPMEPWPCRTSPQKFSHMSPWSCVGSYIQYLVHSDPVILKHDRGSWNIDLQRSWSFDWTIPAVISNSPPGFRDSRSPTIDSSPRGEKLKEGGEKSWFVTTNKSGG